MAIDKDINFGEEKETHVFTNVAAANSQNYTFTGGRIISYALYSNDIDFFFETDGDVDSNSFRVKQDIVWVENLLVTTVYVKSVAGAGTVYLRGIR